MARKKNKRKKATQSARRKARAKKRAQRARAVKTRERVGTRPPPASRPAATVPQPAPQRWVFHDLLHPAVLSPRGPLPPAIETLPGPGPDVFAAAFGEHGIVLYRRSDDGRCAPVSPLELPVDTEVSWWGGAPTVRAARPGSVEWHVRPERRGALIEGAVIVRDLVLDDTTGLFWSPVVPVVAERRSSGVWWLDAGQSLAEGPLAPDGIDWNSGADASHTEVVARFLHRRAGELWALAQQSPGEAPGSAADQPEPPALMDAIRGPSPHYKRRAMDALVARQEDVVPHLLRNLDDLHRSLEEGSFCAEDFSGLYTVVLLAHFRCTQAHERLLALAHLPRDLFEQALGGFLTEDFDTALLATCGGDTTGLRALISDRAADEYLRCQAADALAGAVVLGHADRAEVLVFLASFLSPEHADEHSYFWSGVGGAMLHLFPVGFEDELVGACEQWLIPPLSFDAAFVRQSLAAGPARAPAGLRCVEHLQRRDVHRWMSWWACFA